MEGQLKQTLNKGNIKPNDNNNNSNNKTLLTNS